MSKRKFSKPTDPMPEGATGWDSNHWYKDNGSMVWHAPGKWERCNWGASDPREHISTFPVDQTVRVGVGVILMRDGKVLMGKRKGSHGAGTYSVPGGHLEFGETIGTCAKREVLEETGIVLNDPMFQGGFTNDIFLEEGKHYATLFVIGRNNTGEAENLEPEKCEGWAWYALDALPQPLFLPFQNYMDKVHEHMFGREKLTA